MILKIDVIKKKNVGPKKGSIMLTINQKNLKRFVFFNQALN